MTANTFNVLGVTPERGRTFLAEEDVGEGGHPVVVISHGLWQREFGGNPNIVGSAVRLNQQLFTIVGVLPPEFTGVSGGAHTDVWAPLSMHEYIFHPTDNLHATLSRRREDFFQDGEIAMVGSVLRLDNGVLVVLRMRCGEVSAVIVQVVHLLAVVGSG